MIKMYWFFFFSRICLRPLFSQVIPHSDNIREAPETRVTHASAPQTRWALIKARVESNGGGVYIWQSQSVGGRESGAGEGDVNAHTRAEENARRENSLVEGRNATTWTSMSAELEFAEKRRRSRTDVDRSLYLHFEDISYSVRRGILTKGTYMHIILNSRHNDFKQIVQGVSRKCLEDIFSKLIFVVRKISDKIYRVLQRENKVGNIINFEF